MMPTLFTAVEHFFESIEFKLLFALTEYLFPFQWTPDPPPKKKRRRVTRTADSMMSGFGSSSQVVKEATTPSPDTDGKQLLVLKFVCLEHGISNDRSVVEWIECELMKR